jgi:hypothetical protein
MFLRLKCGISTIITDVQRMKSNMKLISIAICCMFILRINAQTFSIPNGNFENWTTISSEIPKNYVWSSNSDAYRSDIPFNVEKSTDAYHGNYAVKMTTRITPKDTLPGIFVNIYPNDGNPANWHGGFAYNKRAKGIRGYYKSDIASPDTGFVIAFFYKLGVNIGQYGVYFNGKHSEYTKFSLDFFPALTVDPDTVIFGAGSSNYGNNLNMRNGSMILLDSLSFTGVSSQPELFNGDFENWTTTTINQPNDWVLNGGRNGNESAGVFKSNEAQDGDYAIELVTYLSDRNNHSVAEGGRISTGYYTNNCNGCNEKGGFPFSNQVDTLAFWYKYIPSGNTEADVQLNFNKNGQHIGNSGINPSPSASYRYLEVPFSLEQKPDTVIIDIQSSHWQDSATSFVGTRLVIDEMHFKSQQLTTGIHNAKSFRQPILYPNPTNTKLIVNFGKITDKQTDINLVNSLGQTVNSQSVLGSSEQTTLDVSHIEEGIYTVQIKSDNEMLLNEKISILK